MGMRLLQIGFLELLIGLSLSVQRSCHMCWAENQRFAHLTSQSVPGVMDVGHGSSPAAWRRSRCPGNHGKWCGFGATRHVAVENCTVIIDFGIVTGLPCALDDCSCVRA